MYTGQVTVKLNGQTIHAFSLLFSSVCGLYRHKDLHFSAGVSGYRVRRPLVRTSCPSRG